MSGMEDEIEARLIFLRAERAAAWSRILGPNPAKSVNEWSAKDTEIHYLEKALKDMRRGAVTERKKPPRTGPKPLKKQRIMEQMKTDLAKGDDLTMYKQEVLAEKYNAARGTCVSALNDVLSELNSDKS